MKKTCVICGQEGYSYFPFCYKHLQMKNEGKIVKCENCGTWHLTDEPCQCQKKVVYTELPAEGFNTCVACGTNTNGYAFCRKCFKKYTEDEMLYILNKGKIDLNIEDKTDITSKREDNTTNAAPLPIENIDDESSSVISINFKNETKCIICGSKTDRLLFCKACKQKYKNKEFLFRIKDDDNTKFELLDADYEGRYTCKDGHIVKSKSERDIDNYLFEHGIPHAYERELPYGATDKEVLHPDFYLPNYLDEGKHVYIEHWGYNENNIQYTKTKKFKMPIYKKLGITLICTYEKTDMGKIDTVLDRKLNKDFIKINSINYEEPQPTKNNAIKYDSDEDIPF